MKKYEHISIFKIDVKESEINDFNKQFKNIVEFEEMGRKKLAYTIKGNEEGYYIRVVFKAIEEEMKKIEKYCRLNEKIMKFITVEFTNY